MNRHLFLLLSAAVCSPVLRADCINDMRPATEAEKSYHVSTLTALKAAVPPAPAGWKLFDDNRVTAPASVCVGDEKSPSRLAYRARYVLTRKMQPQEKYQVLLTLTANAESFELTDATTLPAQAGAAVVLRSGDKTALGFGPWKVSTGKKGASKRLHTDAKSDFKPGRPSTSVQTVLVMLLGTPKQADEILAGFNSGAVSGLLSR